MALTMRADSINNPEHWRKRAEEMRPGGSPASLCNSTVVLCMECQKLPLDQGT
jgi:hypothetical protein